jgi:hypothetical protein
MPWGEITQFSFSAPPHRPGVCASVQLLNDPRTFGGAYPFRKEFEINSKCRLQVYKSSGASPEALTSGEQFRKLFLFMYYQYVIDNSPQISHMIFQSILPLECWTSSVRWTLVAFVHKQSY